VIERNSSAKVFIAFSHLIFPSLLLKLWNLNQDCV